VFNTVRLIFELIKITNYWKYKPRGGPDGGDGGRGGNVVLEVNPKLNTLFNFRHWSRYVADSGKNGGPNNMSGKSGKDLVVSVPPGTLVFDADSNDMIGDLVEDGQRLLVAKGGRGGLGNQHFATSRNQTPRMAERGEPEVTRNLRLELKMIADIGIVGVPNAGKSSLLSVVTNAKPKIANYPFTTLSPNLGVADLDIDTRLVLADIPGLIEGAHEGVGLGFSFLRHIQRTRVLIHVLDGLSEDPLVDFSQINGEMALFDEKISEKPQIVAFNKMDLPSVQERWQDIKETLIRNCGAGGIPVIKAVDADYGRNRTLYLKHYHDGRDLMLDYAERTLSHLQELWERDVVLETIVNSKETLLRLEDGKLKMDQV